MNRRTALLALLSTAVLSGCGGAPARIGIEAVSAPPPGATERVFAVTSRQPVADRNVLFSGGRSDALHYADIEVSVPPERKTGTIAWPGRSPDLEKEFAATAITLTEDESAFVAGLRQALEARPAGRRTLFVYVHGYNNSFAWSLFRQAQMAHDYRFDGVSLQYSWPSAGRTALYLYDRDSVDFARAGMVRTLRIAYAAEPDSIVLIAHSMGTYLAMEALRELSISGQGHILRMIEALVLASPDIDSDIFRMQLAAFTDRPRLIAAIVSRNDRALKVSGDIRGGSARIGSGGSNSELERLGVIVIDGSKVDIKDDSARHNAFAAAPAFAAMLRANGFALTDIADPKAPTGLSEGIGKEGGRLAGIVRRGKRLVTRD